MNLSYLNQQSLFSADRTMDDFLDNDDLCFTIQKEITPLVHVEDFESMYKEGGRPPVSPKLLILVLIMQYIERLSDRAAASNLRYRIDWKIAFGLDLEFKGINHTTLVYFRERLLSNDKSSYAFDQVLEHLVKVGLVKKNAKQRIDSTHVVGQVRELSRIELLHETLRVFCNEIESIRNLVLSSELRESVTYYGDKISTRGISDAQKDRFVKEAGLAMKAFINWAETPSTPKEVRGLTSYSTLKTVFSQNYVSEDDTPPDPLKPVKLKKVATGKGHVSSPHDPESRYASKGKKDWLGYKAQVSETVAQEKSDVNFITHINVNEATDHDGAEVSAFIKSQKEAGVTPSVVYGDTHYNTCENISTCAENEITLMGPVAPVPAKKSESRTAGFEVVGSAGSLSIHCPDGKTSDSNSQWNDERVKGKFSKEKCSPCGNVTLCPVAKKKGIVVVRPESEILKHRRALMETDEFKKDMFSRNGIEGTISGLVRGQRMRNCRYRGKAKLQLQLKFTGTAANIVRLHRKRLFEVKMAA